MLERLEDLRRLLDEVLCPVARLVGRLEEPCALEVAMGVTGGHLENLDEGGIHG